VLLSELTVFTFLHNVGIIAICSVIVLYMELTDDITDDIGCVCKVLFVFVLTCACVAINDE